MESLTNRARLRIPTKKNQLTLVSIFVNPSQFNKKNDYDTYPRNIKADIKILKKLRVDYVLIPNVKEAGPGNLVPTSSTTNQLALGDAIAITCMIEKKFGKLDFKKFHPAGNLGNKLKTAYDLMLTKTKIPIPIFSSIR